MLLAALSGVYFLFGLKLPVTPRCGLLSKTDRWPVSLSFSYSVAQSFRLRFVASTLFLTLRHSILPLNKMDSVISQVKKLASTADELTRKEMIVGLRDLASSLETTDDTMERIMFLVRLTGLHFNYHTLKSISIFRFRAFVQALT